MAKELDKGLLGKLKRPEINVGENESTPKASPVQKVVPVIENKKETQSQVLFWLNAELKKNMQAQAIREGTNLTRIFVQHAEDWCKQRGIEY